MKRTIVASGVFLGLVLSSVFGATADEQFEKTANDYINTYLAAHPELATLIGDHRFDDRLTDYSAAAREAELVATKKCADSLKQFGDGSKLNSENRIDLKVLAANLDRRIFELSELKEPDWNPMVYSESFGAALYPILARDFAPPKKRIASLRKRLEAIPKVIEQAKQNLQHCPRESTQAAIDQVRDSVTLIRLGLDSLLNQAPDGKKQLAPVQAAAATALEAYMRWFGQDLLRRSDGNFRLGREKFGKKLHLVTGSDLSIEEISSRAKADLQKTQGEMYDIAVALYKKNFPGTTEDAMTDKRKVIKAVLDKLAEQRPKPESIVADLQKITAEASEFAQKNNFIGAGNTPIEVILMPEFRRDDGTVSYCSPPGVLEKGGKTFFAIAPPSVRWPLPRQASLYREYNNFALRDLAARCVGGADVATRVNQIQAPTRVRTVFPSPTFEEGWAIHSEQMMADAGFGGPETKIEQMKMRLRYDCDAILDQSIHASDMNVQGAMNLMKFEGFQEEGQMVATWKRVRLSSTELSVPFVGMIEQEDLLAKAKAKEGASFDLKKYNDQVTSFGSVPFKEIQALMGL